MPDVKDEPTWRTDIDSKYRLVILAAKRSKQLQKGAKPRVNTRAKKPTTIAIEEIERGLVRYSCGNQATR
jgi:DNA-directed RNA polymerase omega subunit